MAIDVYLQIDGIKGESADSEYKGWVECMSLNWGISQPKSATASSAGGHTAERCEMTDISLIKLADMSSPLLAQKGIRKAAGTWLPIGFANMPFVYPNAFRRMKSEKVGNGDCVALVRFYAVVPAH